MIVSVHPPEFLPYLGFWNRMYNTDIMVIADTMRFRHRHYQNRTTIRTPDGWGWLTLPVLRNGTYIRDIELKSNQDTGKTFGFLEANYGGRASFWKEYSKGMQESFSYRKLIDVNLSSLNYIKNSLDIKTKVILSSDITDTVTDDFLALSVHLADVLGADTLLSSSGNIGNLPIRYPNSKIKFVFQDYISIPYPQIYRGWYPRLSVVDCLLTHGAEYTRKHVVGGWSPKETENV